MYAIFLKWKTFTNKEQISDCPELRKEHRGRTGGRYDYRRATGEILVMDSLGLDHGGGYTWDKIVYRMKNTHTHTHTQMSTSKTGEIWVRWVDCTNVNILVVILCYNFAECYHWRELGKGYTQSLWTISYKWLRIYSYLTRNLNEKVIKYFRAYRKIQKIISQSTCLWPKLANINTLSQI